MQNISLYSDYAGSWQLIETKTLSGSSDSETFTKNIYTARGELIDSEFKWNCLAHDSGGSDWGNSNYTFSGWDLGNKNKSLILGTVKGNAANNHLWISGSNTSKKESSFGSFVVQPDGRILHSLRRNYAGILISKIDPNQKFADPSYFGMVGPVYHKSDADALFTVYRAYKGDIGQVRASVCRMVSDDGFPF